MRVNIDGHVIEVETPEDARKLVAHILRGQVTLACLPTNAEVDAAKQDTLSQRAHITRELGFGFDPNGRTTGEAA